ncbi:hypothetical protein, partial [Kitasatospora sp. NPDC018614]|uniref:hypothetical protein n=1 Tax=Kitasatospora sp. NPDC018614 TaxID=3364026 RepID=UPI003794260C
MHSTAFPWLSRLTDEEAYEFLDEVIRAAQDAGTHWSRSPGSTSGGGVDAATRVTTRTTYTATERSSKLTRMSWLEGTPRSSLFKGLGSSPVTRVAEEAGD